MSVVSIKLRITPQRRREVHEEIVTSSMPSSSYYLRAALATIIATFGLLANSTAVVVGAMLVAPLMNPIFGIALGLTIGDRRLLKYAALSEALGISLAIGLAALVGILPLNLGFGSEIMARTEPTLYDLIVAVASGFAGAYAIMDERISAALPGVAIATALVPPLATCGLCLAAMEWHWALGAFLLFAANFLAIELSAAIVFIACGMLSGRWVEALTFGEFLRRFAISISALALVGAFMTRTLVVLVRERRFEQAVKSALSEEVRSATGASVSAIRYENEPQTRTVVATVVTPQEFEAREVANMETALRASVDPRIRLVVRSVISKDFDRSGPIYVPREEEHERRDVVGRQTQFLVEARRVVGQGLRSVAGAQLVDLRRDPQGDRALVVAVVRTPTSIEPRDVARIEDALGRTSALPLRLVVRSILTRDVDRLGTLDDGPTTAPLLPADLRRRERLEVALRDALRPVQGATIVELRDAQTDGRLEVRAVVRSPRQLAPPEVARMEGELRQNVDPRIHLIVQSLVGVEAAADRYLSEAEGEPASLPPQQSDSPPRSGGLEDRGATRGADGQQPRRVPSG